MFDFWIVWGHTSVFPFPVSHPLMTFAYFLYTGVCPFLIGVLNKLFFLPIKKRNFINTWFHCEVFILS